MSDGGIAANHEAKKKTEKREKAVVFIAVTASAGS
jgi:hypothetical protein